MVIAAMVLLGPALWARRVWPDGARFWLAWLAVMVPVACFIVSWWIAKRRFVGVAEALVRLEDRLRMHNRLSAAAVGVCAWPPVPEHPDDGIRWSLANTLLPLLAAAAFLAAALWVPVAARVRPPPPDEPTAWATTENELRELTRQNAAATESLEETQRKIAELRAQDPAKWFSHASLEATDQLRAAHMRALTDLQHQLAKSRDLTDRLASDNAATMPAQKRAALQDQFKQTVQAMQAGPMKPNKELLDRLREIDPSQLNQLSQGDLKELLDDLKEKAEALGKCLGSEPGEGEGDGDTAGDDSGDRSDDNGDEGEGPGIGGVTRGPGTTPGVLGKHATDVEAQKPQFLDPADLSRSLPGDVIDVTDSKHDVDQTSPALRGAGSANTQGGGASTWQESLHPREQEAVKKFFK